MAVRRAKAVWEGDLKNGRGTMSFGSFTGPYSFTSRFETGEGTNPEELIGAAQAGCFAMALSHELAMKGRAPERIEAAAEVSLEKQGEGFAITSVRLRVEGRVPGIDEEEFARAAEEAAESCPVARALGGVRISVEAALAPA
ncbi:MAG: OsmC family peroxiredoxin [Spirochaetota bacterium]